MHPNPTHAPCNPSFGRAVRLTLAGLFGASLLGACDPGDDLDDAGQERAAPTPEAMSNAAEEAILESLEYEPSPEMFEYVGHLDDRSAAQLDAASPERLADTYAEDGRADLLEIITRDGRVYRQRQGTEAIYTSHISRVDDEVPVLGRGEGDDTEEVDALTFRELITDGVDNRTIATTKNKQGVMVRVAASHINTSGTCSASMIAPRVFLTAAHCVTDGSGNYSWGNADYVMPSARGPSFSGNNATLAGADTPWGARQVLRVLRPLGWKSNRGPRFDYAILIIGDHAPDDIGSIQWNPAPIQFATESCGALDGAGVNLRGYPGNAKTCAAAWHEDGTACGGYAYTEYGSIDDCDDDAIYYDHDSQEGQSGAPVYRFDPATGVRTVVGVNKGTDYPNGRNYGHRIRPGSYSTICDAVEDPNNLSSYFSNPSC